jgi:hypothetical protein
MGASHTPADDIIYNLVTIQYHALKGSANYDQYLQDAEGHEDVKQFIQQIKEQDNQRAVRCHQLLAQLTKDSGLEGADTSAYPTESSQGSTQGSTQGSSVNA